MRVESLVAKTSTDKNFAGAEAILVVNCRVSGRVAAIFAILVGFVFSAAGQEPSSPLAFYQPSALNNVDGATLMHQLPMLALLDGRHLPLTTPMGRMGLLPVNLSSTTSFNVAQVRAVGGPATEGKDSSKEMQPSHLDPLFYSGEVDFFYGHSSGKFGGDEYGSSFQGTVGNDKVQITVGGTYDESNGRVPRWAR
jgi:hypothetical protein